MGFIQRLFSTDGFMPHGMCYEWNASVIWLHVVSDAVIAFSYYSIPLTLIYFVRKRKDLVFNWMFVCFAVFIVACGTTHLMEILNIWHPDLLAVGNRQGDHGFRFDRDGDPPDPAGAAGAGAA
jgi:hypothetical protein